MYLPFSCIDSRVRKIGVVNQGCLEAVGGKPNVRNEDGMAVYERGQGFHCASFCTNDTAVRNAAM